ncbi:MAG: hypothetical protein PPHEINF_5371 [uncultured Paraburkholderia sp.]|nr:MAG: hypothetical protein PPHEINF_5371 [uncultured Paraburkholderia sp.]CAH2811220.1 MAG: hypothetical protein PPHEESC_6332 [uncultured Paraburkholderia sp.]CAH2942383.1 MAG: hypothetical protein PPHERAN_5544 [uncultured Paraburkholderia sp.]CAH2946157.1 MAG: hypothetical protein PPHEMADMSA_6433 [uncultured Paraburkholderia sp.]
MPTFTLNLALKNLPVLDEQLIDGLPVAMYVCDLNGAIVRYNKIVGTLFKPR